MRNGEIQPNPIESNEVKEIFVSYLSGSSLNEIANLMTSKRVPYSEVSMVWNKNMVKRILENEKYLGKGDYSALIDTQTFEKANAKNRKKQLRFA